MWGVVFTACVFLSVLFPHLTTSCHVLSNTPSVHGVQGGIDLVKEIKGAGHCGLRVCVCVCVCECVCVRSWCLRRHRPRQRNRRGWASRPACACVCACVCMCVCECVCVCVCMCVLVREKERESVCVHVMCVCVCSYVLVAGVCVIVRNIEQMQQGIYKNCWHKTFIHMCTVLYRNQCEVGIPDEKTPMRATGVGQNL